MFIAPKPTKVTLALHMLDTERGWGGRREVALVVPLRARELAGYRYGGAGYAEGWDEVKERGS